jgi:hypothetical protein
MSSACLLFPSVSSTSPHRPGAGASCLSGLFVVCYIECHNYPTFRCPVDFLVAIFTHLHSIFVAGVILDEMGGLIVTRSWSTVVCDGILVDSFHRCIGKRITIRKPWIQGLGPPLEKPDMGLDRAQRLVPRSRLASLRPRPRRRVQGQQLPENHGKAGRHSPWHGTYESWSSM